MTDEFAADHRPNVAVDGLLASTVTLIWALIGAAGSGRVITALTPGPRR
jgi:predicted ribonuclease YlaK